MLGKILFIGDMHLGRVPGHLPSVLVSSGLDAENLGPAAAWRRCVAYAIRQNVDAVVLAGDVVESDNARFEAFGLLKQGIDQLLAEGITVCAVAGNHDVEALPRLAGLLDGFHLLGEGGRWEYFPLQRDGQTVAQLLGWSFPDHHVLTDPLADGLPPPPDDHQVLGVLHCDLNSSHSRYAPTSSLALQAAHPAAWFLGHIHKPSLQAGAPTMGYLGSIVGLDPTETGCHGPWLVEIDPAGKIRSQQVALAPLRWENLSLSVDGLDSPTEELLGLLTRATTRLAEQLSPELTETKALGCRIQLTGRTRSFRELTALLADPTQEQLCFPVGGVHLFIDKIIADFQPALDLDELATGDTLLGLLAADLRALTQRSGRGRELIATARLELEKSADRSPFMALPPWEPDDEAVRELLLKSGCRALEELLAQQEELS